MVCDRFSTSLTLVSEALALRWYVTGTLRGNYAPPALRSLPLTERGQWDYVCKNIGGKYAKYVYVYKWIDSCEVYLMSSSVTPGESSVVRRVPGELVKKSFIAPTVAVEFNTRMGGVDAADARRSAYTVDRRRTRKWTTKVYFFTIDVAANNAYVMLSKALNDEAVSVRKVKGVQRCSRQRFHEALARQLIEKGLGKSIEGAMAADMIPSGQHLPVHSFGVDDNPRRLCCCMKDCGSRTSIMCEACHVAYCLRTESNCFYKHCVGRFPEKNKE